VLIFVADGLRHDSVNAQDTPALWRVRTEGVHFANSHSLFPTFTTANASAIATGHFLGDTGDFSNTIWTGFATFDTGNFHLPSGSPVPFLEDDRLLADLDAHVGGNYLGSPTFLAMARAHGYRTASMGKMGPAAIQDAAAIAPVSGGFPPLAGLVIDDNTAGPTGLAWPSELLRALHAAGIPPPPPTRSNGYGPTSPYNNGYTGDRAKPGTVAPNAVQQQWFDDVAARVVLPWLTQDPSAPFVLLFWSREPDGSQHNQGDSLNTFSPGINGDTAKRGVRLADRSLQRLLAWIDARPKIKANTDVFVTSDHGFATISRDAIDANGRKTASESAKHDYAVDGTVDTATGSLPNGFLAIDLAYDLQLNLFDPDRRTADGRGFAKLRIGSSGAPLNGAWEHPARGNGLLGPNVSKADGSDARIIVAANGGSDLIYIPDGSADTVRQVVGRLMTYDYVAGVFVDETTYGRPDGTLAFSAINFVGESRLPRPAIVVAFKVFYLKPGDLLTAVQISDTSLQSGQGMHGGFGRDSTFNNMAAMGPDFKRRFVDPLPVGNADITPTLLRVLGFDPVGGGRLRGRAAVEALRAGPAPAAAVVQTRRSEAANGKQTVLQFQEYHGVLYSDAACVMAPNAMPTAACR
jgi:arylsulfatase A-like enzyme